MRRKQIILFMQPHHITSTSMEHVNQNECHFYKHMSYKIVLFSICNIDKEFMFVGFCLFVFGFNISLQIQLVLESWQISCQHISTSQASQPVELVFETMNDCEDCKRKETQTKKNNATDFQWSWTDREKLRKENKK